MLSNYFVFVHVFNYIFVIAIILAVTAFVVFIERGQRRITVNYAKRQIGNKIYGGSSSIAIAADGPPIPVETTLTFSPSRVPV